MIFYDMHCEMINRHTTPAAAGLTQANFTCFLHHFSLRTWDTRQAWSLILGVQGRAQSREEFTSLSLGSQIRPRYSTEPTGGLLTGVQENVEIMESVPPLCPQPRNTTSFREWLSSWGSPVAHLLGLLLSSLAQRVSVSEGHSSLSFSRFMIHPSLHRAWIKSCQFCWQPAVLESPTVGHYADSKGEFSTSQYRKLLDIFCTPFSKVELLITSFLSLWFIFFLCTHNSFNLLPIFHLFLGIVFCN